ncbi:unnamed protein product [Caenorhabditis nigoni]
MYIPPLCPILSPYFYNPLCFFKGVMIVMNHSKTCKFIIQSLLVLNRMTSVIWPLEYSKMWRKWVKWAVALIILLPLATDWNLVISRVYMEPMFGGFYFFYTRKVAWVFYAFFPYLPGGIMVSLAHVAYDVLDVGSPIIMIAVNKSLRHHVFRMTLKN